MLCLKLKGGPLPVLLLVPFFFVGGFFFFPPRIVLCRVWKMLTRADIQGHHVWRCGQRVDRVHGKTSAAFWAFGLLRLQSVCGVPHKTWLLFCRRIYSFFSCGVVVFLFSHVCKTHIVSWHIFAAGFAWLDSSKVLWRFKIMKTDNVSYGSVLPTVLFNQFCILLPIMIVRQHTVLNVWC